MISQHTKSESPVSFLLLHQRSDFALRSIYIELSEAYKKIDPASNASKRRALASHLKESVDSLESKVRWFCLHSKCTANPTNSGNFMQADEIRRMYDMLHYAESSGAKATFHAR